MMLQNIEQMKGGNK